LESKNTKKTQRIAERSLFSMDLAILTGISSTVVFIKNQRFKNSSFLLFVLFSLLPKVQAQIPQSADSPAIYLKKSPKDTNYVKALNEYSWKLLEQGNYSLADSLAKQAEAPAIKSQFPFGEYGSSNALGRSAYV
jgi:hypothetical protein